MRAIDAGNCPALLPRDAAIAQLVEEGDERCPRQAVHLIEENDKRLAGEDGELGKELRDAL